LVGSHHVDEVGMGNEHPPTAVAVDAEIVEHLGRVLAVFDPTGERLPVLADDLTTRETPDWYHHG
jgi:hypothetical protein